MTPEKTNYLFETYPELFYFATAVDREAAGSPIRYGIDCADGWFALVEDLCGTIKNRLDWVNKYDKEGPMVVRVVQVKEKMGGLRFYTSMEGKNEKFRYWCEGVIHFAESFSYMICESCGNAGKLRPSGWHRTLCDSCENEREQQRHGSVDGVSE